MVELVDTLVSGTSAFSGMEVQVFFRAEENLYQSKFSNRLRIILQKNKSEDGQKAPKKVTIEPFLLDILEKLYYILHFATKRPNLKIDE